MYNKLRGLYHRYRHLIREAEENARRDRNAVSEPVLSFWRDHGRAWAAAEASQEDLQVIRQLAARIGALRKKARERETVGSLKRIWAEGFDDSSAAFPWDGLDDRLPAAALVAFVTGAGEVAAHER